MKPKDLWKILLITATATACLLWLTSCAYLLTGSTDPAHVETIMKATNSRGCILGRADAKPWAQAALLLFGTWGDNPPSQEDCWKGMPVGGP